MTLYTEITKQTRVDPVTGKNQFVAVFQGAGGTIKTMYAEIPGAPVVPNATAALSSTTPVKPALNTKTITITQAPGSGVVNTVELAAGMPSWLTLTPGAVAGTYTLTTKYFAGIDSDPTVVNNVSLPVKLNVTGPGGTQVITLPALNFVETLQQTKKAKDIPGILNPGLQSIGGTPIKGDTTMVNLADVRLAFASAQINPGPATAVSAGTNLFGFSLAGNGTSLQAHNTPNQFTVGVASQGTVIITHADGVRTPVTFPAGHISAGANDFSALTTYIKRLAPGQNFTFPANVIFTGDSSINHSTKTRLTLKKANGQILELPSTPLVFTQTDNNTYKAHTPITVTYDQIAAFIGTGTNSFTVSLQVDNPDLPNDFQSLVTFSITTALSAPASPEQTPNKISVFPNPAVAGTAINLEYNRNDHQNTPVSVSFNTVLGQPLATTQVLPTGNRLAVKLPVNAKGMIFITIKDPQTLLPMTAKVFVP